MEIKIGGNAQLVEKILSKESVDLIYLQRKEVICISADSVKN